MVEGKKRFARDIRPDEHINEIFICQKKGEFVGKTGLPYMSLTLIDKSGSVDGKVWDGVEKLSPGFAEGDYIRVKASASQYNGKVQLRISDIQKVSQSQVNAADYLPSSSYDISEMTSELHELLRREVTCEPLALLVESFLGDEAFLPRYQRTPAAKAIHHSFVGGLLEHTLSLARLAVLICGHYPQVDRSMLLTGVFFHDLGKVRELDVGGTLGYTDEGRLIGHITLGIELMNEHIARIPNFPPELKMVLTHLILSHHGTLEFGSPKRPKTIEAQVLSAIDDLDARVNSFSTILEDETQDGRWTNYQRIYDRYLYRWQGPEKLKHPDAPKSSENAPKEPEKKRESFSNSIRLALDESEKPTKDKAADGVLPLFAKPPKAE